MLELIAVCYLVGQTLFAVPAGWTAIAVYSGGARPYVSGQQLLTLADCPAECQEERTKAYVRLRRQIAPGETVEAPAGCKLTATRPEGH